MVEAPFGLPGAAQIHHHHDVPARNEVARQPEGPPLGIPGLREDPRAVAIGERSVVGAHLEDDWKPSLDVRPHHLHVQIDPAVRLVRLGDRHLEDLADDLVRRVDRLREPSGERVVRGPEAVGAARDCRDELREEHSEDGEQPRETTPHVPQHRRPPANQCEERDNASPLKARGWESGKPLYVPGVNPR